VHKIQLWWLRLDTVRVYVASGLHIARGRVLDVTGLAHRKFSWTNSRVSSIWEVLVQPFLMGTDGTGTVSEDLFVLHTRTGRVMFAPDRLCQAFRPAGTRRRLHRRYRGGIVVYFSPELQMWAEQFGVWAANGQQSTTEPSIPALRYEPVSYAAHSNAPRLNNVLVYVARSSGRSSCVLLLWGRTVSRW
jgi:hypothetical protein